MTATTTLPVLDPSTMRVTGEAEVDASRAVPLPDLPAPEVLLPGSTWTDPDGTVYDVVRAEDVGDQPRWWFLAGFRGDQIRLEHPGELHTDAVPGDTLALLALVLRDRREPLDAGTGACSEVVTGAASTFSLESARALLANLEHLPPDVSADDARVDLWVELRAACDEVERLRARISGPGVDLAAMERRADAHAAAAAKLETEAAGWVASYDKLGKAIEAHLPERAGDLVARIANAGAVIADARASRDAYQQEARTAERRLTEERSARIEVVQRLERTEATLKRWQTRARKAEARVTALTEERDGLTLRLGEQERKRVQRGAKRTAGKRKAGRP